jgi:hypothetical protein
MSQDIKAATKGRPMSDNTTSKGRWALVAVAVAALTLVPSALAASNTGFGFNAPDISGALNGGAARLTGGGAFDPNTGFVHSGGGFRCTSDVLNGPLNGCLAGQGVRWDTADLRVTTPFTCTGESEQPATTDENTVGLDADFYRAGDGNDESFNARMIVSAEDIAPAISGVQNVWVQGVGCGSAIVHFSHPQT